ncbi:MAG: hypothetical protein K9I47_09265 [Bacteroidales bacterium]|nr:hypothetical protein [Bacteroidales bacterium]
MTEKRIETEKEYQKAVREIEQLDGAPEGSEEDKKLKELYDQVEDYEDRKRPETKLFTLKRKLAQYSEKEITVYQKMANQYLDYSKRLKAGEDVEKPEFDPELVQGMREWAKLTQEINRLEKLEKEKNKSTE